MDKCRKYSPEDFEAIQSWYKSRDMAPLEDLIPKIGFIVPGVAAGFMMQTDTKCCILEPFISNPLVDSEKRKEALDLIMGELILEAFQLGYNRIYGFSTVPSMVNRALKWGFKTVEKNSTTVCKELF